jgi:hypothetical protein
MTKLPPIQPTVEEMAGDHARRIVGAINDLAQRISRSYADQPALPPRKVKHPQTGQPTDALATPAVKLTDIQARLGPETRATVEKILAALNPATPAPETKA